MNPDLTGMLEKLLKIAPEAVRWQNEISTMTREMDELGFPEGLALGGTGAVRPDFRPVPGNARDHAGHVPAAG